MTDARGLSAKAQKAVAITLIHKRPFVERDPMAAGDHMSTTHVHALCRNRLDEQFLWH